MPLMSLGQRRFFLREWKVPGSWMKAKQKCTSFISVRGVLAVPGVDAPPCRPCALAKMKGSWPTAMIGKRPGLVAGIDVGEVGDAVARHVVVVERLAELLATGRASR